MYNNIPKIGLKNKSKRLIVHMLVENVSSYIFIFKSKKGPRFLAMFILSAKCYALLSMYNVTSLLMTQSCLINEAGMQTINQS